MQKENKRAKFIKDCHTVADKVGKTARKVLPWAASAGAVIFAIVKGGKGSSRKI